MMKKYLTVLTLLVLSTQLWGKSKEAMVLDVRKDYIKVEKAIKKKKYIKKTVKFAPESSEDTMAEDRVTVYEIKGNGKYKKYHIETILDANVYNTYLYVKDDKLFFFYKVMKVNQYTADNVIVHTNEDRYYLKDGKLFKHLTRSYTHKEKPSKVKQNEMPVGKAKNSMLLKTLRGVKKALTDPKATALNIY